MQRHRGRARGHDGGRPSRLAFSRRGWPLTPGVGPQAALFDQEGEQAGQGGHRLPLPGRAERSGERPPQRGLPARRRPHAPARPRLRVGEKGAVGQAIVGVDRGQRLATLDHAPQQQALRLAVVGAAGVRRALGCAERGGLRRREPSGDGISVVADRDQHVGRRAPVVPVAAVERRRAGEAVERDDRGLRLAL
jgi:hypothetical protein